MTESSSTGRGCRPLSPRPRVLVLAPDFPPARGGIQKLLYEVTRSFESVAAHVVAPRRPGWQAFDATSDVAITRCPAAEDKRVEMAGMAAVAGAKALRWRPDMLLVGHVIANPTARAICRLRGIPSAQYLYADEVCAWPRFVARSISHVDLNIAVSDYTRRLAEGASKGLPAPCVIVHPGVELPTEPGPALSEREPIVLVIARLADRYKGHDMLIAAMPAVAARVPSARLVVVGDGPLRADLESAAATLMAPVIFTGEIVDDARDEWLRRARVFAMPSRIGPSHGAGEGWGIAYMEAAAFGVPSVAGGQDGSAEAVLDGQTGVLVDPTSPGAIGEAIASLLLDSSYASALGRNARERAASYSWSLASSQVERALLGLTRRAS